MTTLPRRATFVLPILWAAGCGVAQEPNFDVVHEDVVQGNGQVQNGQVQNGQVQNGQVQNGAGMQLVGADLRRTYRLVNPPAAGQNPDLSATNLVLVPNVHLDKSTLTDGVSSGVAFQGDVVLGQVMDEFGGFQSVYVYIESVSPSVDPEIMHYVLKAYHRFVPAAGQVCNGTCPMVWDYVCGSFREKVIDPNGGLYLRTVGKPATAVGGQWDYHQGVKDGGSKIIEQSSPDYDTQITFACSTGAIGKCVETMHYKPWAPAARECKFSGTFPIIRRICYQPTQELLHEACVRMVRADYCGDGQDHTINGISIDVWDQSSIETETPYSQTPGPNGVPYGHEAEWTPRGARCVNNMLMTRTSHLGSGQSVGEYLMDSGAGHSYCQEHWGKGTTNWLAPCFLDSSTFFISNVSSDLDWHDRVFIRNKSVCIDDGGQQPNPMKTSNPWCAMCLPDQGVQPICPISAVFN